MKTNKWYFNSKGEILELIIIISKTEKGYRLISLQNGLIKITEYPDFLTKKNFKECIYLEIKNNRYTIFDELYNYLGEINI